MIKTFVIDTNVFLDNPRAIFDFEEHEVVISEVVLEEMDNFKDGKEEININAREMGRILQNLKDNSTKNFFEGIDLPNGGKLYIKSFDSQIELPEYWDKKKRDNGILKTCLTLQQLNKNVVLVTKDIYMGIKAESLNIHTEEYRKEIVVPSENQYLGRAEVYTDEESFKTLINTGMLSTDKIYKIYHDENNYKEIYEFEFCPREFWTIHNATTGATKLTMVSADKKYAKVLQHEKAYPFGIKPRNSSQLFMQEALLNDDIPLVLIKGMAGSAKSLFSLATGLQKVIEENVYRKVLVTRPYQELEGQEMGFLPGTQEEKLMPYLGNFQDNFSVLVDSNIENRDNVTETSDKVQELWDRGYVEMQALSYIRGRSFEKVWFICDEAQNMNQTCAKTLVTRAGEGTKIIVLGDTEQIDNKYLSARNNGLSYLIEKMKNSPLCAIVTTTENDVVRSPLAKECVKYLCE